MIKAYEVDSVEKAFIYLADCQLATVCRMAMKKRRPVGEFDRQIRIAQKFIDWSMKFNIDMSGTRGEEVVNRYDCSVARYAKFFIED